jgi:hypothetical protein
MIFRQADQSDIFRLIDMRLAYLSEDFGGLTDEEALAIKSQLEEYFKKHLNNDLLVYVCEDNALLVSTVFLQISGKAGKSLLYNRIDRYNYECLYPAPIPQKGNRR